MSPQEENRAEEVNDLMMYTADQTAPMDAVRRPSTIRRESFLQEFASSKGPPQIIILIMLLALGFGSTIGVVPAVMTDRYARLNHGYMEEKDCSEYLVGEKPQACLDGSADAQSAVAMEQMVSNTLTFFTSSFIGSMSDEHGRKGTDDYEFSKLLRIFLHHTHAACILSFWWTQEFLLSVSFCLLSLLSFWSFCNYDQK